MLLSAQTASSAPDAAFWGQQEARATHSSADPAPIASCVCELQGKEAQGMPVCICRNMWAADKCVCSVMTRHPRVGTALACHKVRCLLSYFYRLFLIKAPACLVEDPETKRRRPRNYVETLEARVAFLEDRSQTPAVGGSPSSFPTPEVQQESSHGAFISDEGDSSTDLSLQTGILDVRSAQPEPQYLGPSSTFSFSHIINSSLSRHLPERSKFPPGLPGLLSRGAPSPSMPFLLYNDLALTLSNAYFANIQPQYPFLHEPTFRLWEKKLSTQSQEATNLGVDSVPLFFVNMVGTSSIHNYFMLNVH